MSVTELLAILTIDKSKPIRCQAEGCGRGVYKAVHVIKKDDGQIMLFGSDCYKRLCGDREVKPSYGSWSDSVMTDEQRQALLDNTEELLQQLKTQFERKTKIEDAPLPVSVGMIENVQPSVTTASNFDYETERNLICMACWTSFRSNERRCPTCHNIDSVVTQALK